MATLIVSAHDQYLQALLKLIKIEADNSIASFDLLASFVDPDFGYNVLEVRQMNMLPRGDAKILWIDVKQEHEDVLFEVSFTNQEFATRYEHPHIGAVKREWSGEQILKLAKFIIDYLTNQETHIDPLNGKG